MPSTSPDQDSPPDAAGADRVVRTVTIARPRWPETCAVFSQRHLGWLTRVLTLPTPAADGDIGDAREIAHDLPLAEVVLAAGDPQPGIDIRVRDPGPLTVHRVERPQSLALEEAADGTVLGLRIDDVEGRTTLVRFRTVLPPEMLDGLAAGER